MVKRDLTGQVFGRLTVIKQVEDKQYSSGKCVPAWLCQCSCDARTQVIVSSGELTRKNNGTRSCGCLKKELSTKRLYKYSKKYNDYEVQEDYVIMYTQKGEPFFVDLEDFWRVKEFCWHKTMQGYICTHINRKAVLLHNFIMNCSPDMVTDHIGNNDTLNDCRKANLRIASRSQNGYNRKPYKSNKTGVTGVLYLKNKNKYIAYITVNKKRINLGTFDDFTIAVKARKEAEEKYYGEWSYDNSQRLWRQNNE